VYKNKEREPVLVLLSDPYSQLVKIFVGASELLTSLILVFENVEDRLE